MTRADRFDADRVAELEAERDFLLRSLDDLERERATGNIEPAEYERLRDDYTARAAAVLRAIRDGIDARPVAPPMSRARKLVIGGALIAFAVVAALLLASAMGERKPGESLTGNAQASPAAQVAAARQAVADRPNDSQAHLAYATALVGTKEYATALREYDTAFRLDPKNVAARAYGGWLLFLLSGDVGGDSLDKSQRLIEEAITADPAYPDAHFFKGMVLLRGRNQPDAAIPELERYLTLAPTGEFADNVRRLVDQVRGAATSTGPATTATTRTAPTRTAPTTR